MTFQHPYHLINAITIHQSHLNNYALINNNDIIIIYFISIGPFPFLSNGAIQKTYFKNVTLSVEDLKPCLHLWFLRWFLLQFLWNFFGIMKSFVPILQKRHSSRKTLVSWKNFTSKFFTFIYYGQNGKKIAAKIAAKIASVKGLTHS